MNDVVTEIKNKVDLVDYIGSFVQLKKRGRHYVGLCPFHKENSPSFVVSPERDLWYCFGACHEGGDVISFLMKWDNLSFMEAVKELAHMAGIPDSRLNIKEGEADKTEILYTINSTAAEYYRYVLTKTDVGKKARQYLENRGVNERIAETFSIGYAPSSWESLYKFLRKRGYTDSDIARTGLVGTNRSGKQFDRFRGRIMFPLYNHRDQVIGFSGRILEGLASDAKYINIPETEIYRKRETLYGINVTREHIRNEGAVLVVEGEFDVIMPFEHGVKHVVAIKGSSVTKEQLKLLKRYAKKIILALDSDDAGHDAAMRAIREAQNIDVELHILNLPEGKDPDEVVRVNPSVLTKALKNNVTPAYDFVIDYIHGKYQDDDVYSKKKLTEEVIPFLAEIENPVVLAHYTRKVSGITEVPEESIEEVLHAHKRGKERALANQITKTVGETRKEPLVERQERHILRLIFQDDEQLKVYDSIQDELSSDVFTVPSHKKLIEALGEYRMKVPSDTTIAIESFMKQLPSQFHAVFDELYLDVNHTGGIDLKQLKRDIYSLKKRRLREQIKEVASNAEATDAQQKLQKLRSEYNRIDKLLR